MPRFKPLGLALALVATGLLLAASAHTALAAENPVSIENSLPGKLFWAINVKPPADIAGYAGEISVRPGQALDLHVNSQQRYRVEIYRLGWYHGLGSRTMKVADADRPACGPAVRTSLAT